MFQHPMDTTILESIGFSKGEVKVYFALLELGEASIGPLSRTARVTPAKTYPILDKLVEKGLITLTIKSNTKYYQAFNPSRILIYLEEKKKHISEEEEAIKKLLPSLIAKQKVAAQQSTSVYQSFKGMQTLYDEIIEELVQRKDDFIGFTLGDEYQSIEANLFFKNYDTKRKGLGIKIKLIGLRSQKAFLKREYPTTKYKEIRYMKQALPTGVVIYGDRVATFVWKKVPVAFVIQSKETADAYKRFFWDLWKKANH